MTNGGSAPRRVAATHFYLTESVVEPVGKFLPYEYLHLDV